MAVNMAMNLGGLVEQGVGLVRSSSVLNLDSFLVGHCECKKGRQVCLSWVVNLKYAGAVGLNLILWVSSLSLPLYTFPFPLPFSSHFLSMWLCCTLFVILVRLLWI
jgi:hypothetical protein